MTALTIPEAIAALEARLEMIQLNGGVRFRYGQRPKEVDEGILAMLKAMMAEESGK